MFNIGDAVKIIDATSFVRPIKTGDEAIVEDICESEWNNNNGIIIYFPKYEMIQIAYPKQIRNLTIDSLTLKEYVDRISSK